MFALYYFVNFLKAKQKKLSNNLLSRRAAETPPGSVFHLDSPLESLCTTVLARVH